MVERAHGGISRREGKARPAPPLRQRLPPIDAVAPVASDAGMQEHSFDAIVVGGGLVGARHRLGAGPPGAAAGAARRGDVAFRAAGAISAWSGCSRRGSARPWYQRWTRASAAEWPALAAELGAKTGADIGLRQPGGVHLCLSDTEMADRAARMARMQAEAGNHPFEYRMIEAAELRGMLPGLGPAVVGASWTPYDGHANPLPPAACAAPRLHRGAAGPMCRRPRSRTGEAAPGDFAVTAGGRPLHAPRIVLAAGLGNAALAPRFGLAAPVRPQRGQILVTERAAELLPMPVTTIRQTQEGSLMMGDSMEEVGFDAGRQPAVMRGIAERAVLSFPGSAG